MDTKIQEMILRLNEEIDDYLKYVLNKLERKINNIVNVEIKYSDSGENNNISMKGNSQIKEVDTTRTHKTLRK